MPDDAGYVLVACQSELIGQGLVALLRAHSSAAVRIAWRAPARVIASVGAVPNLVLLAPEADWTSEQLMDVVRVLVFGGSAVVVLAAVDDPAAARAVIGMGAAAHLAPHTSSDRLVAALVSALSAPAISVLPEPAEEVTLRPALSLQERRVLELYLDGLTISATARRMGISSHTVGTYLKRARAKFAACGHPAPSAVDLYRAAVRLGVLAAPTVPSSPG